MADPRDPGEVVRAFCQVWPAGDVDAIMAFFADDADYHNIPMEPLHGLAEIRDTVERFLGMVDRIEFDIRNIAVAGNVVLTERVDYLISADRTIELPVMGAFEVVDGRIRAWRDYFDLNQLQAQMQG